MSICGFGGTVACCRIRATRAWAEVERWAAVDLMAVLSEERSKRGGV
jgi:hypothetical protein